MEPGRGGLRLPLGEDLVAGHVHARGPADTEGSSLSPRIKRRIRTKTSLAELERKERGRTNIPGPPRLRTLINDAAEVPISEGSLVPASTPTSGIQRVHPYTPVGDAVGSSSFEMVPPVRARAVPEAAGVFQWTSLGESDLQGQPKRTKVPLPNPEALGIDTLIYFWEKTWGARTPWNEGIREQIEQGHLGATYHLDPDNPVQKEGRVPMLTVPTLLSDVNKITWMRVFLGWAYRCVKTHSPEGAMPPHSDLVHFIAELFASLTVAMAKPLSECGQGIPVYAAGTEIRTGSDGLKTSDWGNDIFVEAAKSVSPGLFVNVGDNKSDRGDRVESLFNISFWTKEGAVDWSWLGLDTPGKEREADSLVVAMEWKCFKIAERDLVDSFLDSPWSCAMSVLRVLQMCEADDLSVLQIPKTCPWCHHVLKQEGTSLYMQIWTYLDHARTGTGYTNTYTGILVGSEVKGQAFPDVRDLLSVKNKQAVKEFESSAAVVYISGKGHRQWPSVAESTMIFIAKCVGKAREEFIRQIAVLRLRQKSVQIPEGRSGCTS